MCLDVLHLFTLRNQCVMAQSQERIFSTIWQFLTLHDFRRTTDQIGCDISRRVIAGNRGKWLTSGPLRCTISHYTTDFPRLRITSQFTEMSQIFWTCSKCYDGLRYPPIVRIAADRIAEGLTLHDVLSATASLGSSQVVVSSKSCSVRSL